MSRLFYKFKCMFNFLIAFGGYLVFFLATRSNLYKSKNRIYIFGTGNGLYENNVGVLCDYVLANVIGTDVYFVSDKIKALPKDNKLRILKKGSVKSYFISIISDVIVFDTSHFDVAPGVHRFLSAVKVNVNHGLEGLKRLPTDYYKNIIADINCSVSDLELNIKVKECGINPNKVFLTGLPRFDRINLTQSNSNDNILLFLTWRSWLFKDSERIKEYSDTVKKFINQQVSDSLGKRTLYIKAHGQMSSNLTSDYSNIVILSEFDDFTASIQNCAALITDYSSVAWDFIYNDRPVFFYCYDYEEYKDKQGLYIDYKNTFINNFSVDFSDVLRFLCKPESSVLDSTPFFKYQDANNCKRVVDLINQHL